MLQWKVWRNKGKKEVAVCEGGGQGRGGGVNEIKREKGSREGKTGLIPRQHGASRGRQ